MQFMEEQVEMLLPVEVPPKRNRGRFRPGDPRINRGGRPRGSKRAAAAEGVAPGDVAPSTDRLMALALPLRHFVHRLSHRFSIHFTNLPRDAELVASHVDQVRGLITFTFRSATFPRIARGALLPKFADLRGP